MVDDDESPPRRPVVPDDEDIITLRITAVWCSHHEKLYVVEEGCPACIAVEERKAQT